MFVLETNFGIDLQTKQSSNMLQIQLSHANTHKLWTEICKIN